MDFSRQSGQSTNLLINRPGVAGAVIETPLSLINRPGVAGAVLQTSL